MRSTRLSTLDDKRDLSLWAAPCDAFALSMRHVGSSSARTGTNQTSS